MDFRLTTEQLELRQRVATFARRELAKSVLADDSTEQFPTEDWRKCAAFGMLGWPVSEEHGGSGLDPLTVAIGLEALGYGCRDNGLAFAIGNHLWACTVYLVEHGSEEQRRRYLPRMCDGSLIGAQALTEEAAGSDVLALATTATPDDGDYLLDGVKTFISNAAEAGLFVVFARTSPERSQSSLTAFLVPRDLPGVDVSFVSKSGLRTTSMGRVRFERCRVGADAILGEVGGGFRVFTTAIEWERIFLFAPQVGVMQRLVEDAVVLAASRTQFGRPIGAFQAVAHRIADMKVRAELARLVLYHTAWLKAEGRVAPLESSIAKLFIAESLLSSALDAVRIHGARGYVSEFGVERELRDALAGPI